MQQVLRAAPLAAVPVAAAPVAAAPVAAAPVAAVETDAVKRLGVAQEILGRYDPNEFEKLPADRRDAAMAELWDGWRSRGLVAEVAAASAGGGSPDALILEGVNDKSLTYANKSVFLGVGVLGYPLEDSLWLSRTRISDALEENALAYPSGQRWRTDDGTPEFLGTSVRAQPLVDAWGAATDYGRAITRQVERRSRELPTSAAATPAAAAGFARVVAELVGAHDLEAVEYLKGRDPTFSAFLLDARKPGYYLYNGDRSVVARIMATRAAQSLGIRRVDQTAEHGPVVPSTYYYRPARVVERLREAAQETAPQSDEVRRSLAAYADRMAPLVEAPAKVKTEPYRFVEPEFLPGSALQSDANRFTTRAAPGNRLDFPLPLGTLRARVRGGERYMQFTPERWTALGLLLESSPELASAPDAAVLRFVAEPFQSGSRKVSPLSDGRGVAVQVAVLDDLARLEANDPAALKRELRFLSAAFSAALHP
jgi:hypothetical protein